MFVDSHCHLDFPELRERLPELTAAMIDAQVTRALCISVARQTVPDVLAVAATQPGWSATVGIHPDRASDEVIEVDALLALADHPRVVGIGETGLDYYRLEGDLEWQRERFRTHIRAARRLNKPLIIHSREAAADTLRILDEEGAEAVGGIFHCFTETEAVARAAIERGFLISFSGILTFKNARDLKAVAKALPLDRLLIETDSPYLAPQPQRGKTNQPAWVRYVAEALAMLQGVAVERVGEQTSANYCRLFGLSDAG